MQEYGLQLAKMFLNPGARVLDIGGELSTRLSEVGFDVLATDFDHLPTPDQSLDAVMAFTLAQISPTAPGLVLTEFRRMLKPGGKLICAFPNVMHPASRLRTFCTGSPFEYGRRSRNLCVFTEGSLCRRLSETGFQTDYVAWAGAFKSPVARALCRLGVTAPADEGDGAWLFVVAH